MEHMSGSRARRDERKLEDMHGPTDKRTTDGNLANATGGHGCRANEFRKFIILINWGPRATLAGKSCAVTVVIVSQKTTPGEPDTHRQAERAHDTSKEGDDSPSRITSIKPLWRGTHTNTTAPAYAGRILIFIHPRIGQRSG